MIRPCLSLLVGLILAFATQFGNIFSFFLALWFSWCPLQAALESSPNATASFHHTTLRSHFMYCYYVRWRLKGQYLVTYVQIVRHSRHTMNSERRSDQQGLCKVLDVFFLIHNEAQLEKVTALPKGPHFHFISLHITQFISNLPPMFVLLLCTFFLFLKMNCVINAGRALRKLLFEYNCFLGLIFKDNDLMRHTCPS